MKDNKKAKQSASMSPRPMERAKLAGFARIGQRLYHDQRGQGTTEYAILVGVLVVIAIIAVIAFRENLQSLWDSIADNIKSL